MSAKEDLIATALTVAGAVRWQYPELSVDLREACARAMVQPAAPDMAEVERRLETYEEACRSGQWEPERTALLDAVRAIAAERDALRDAAKMVSGATCPECGSSNTQWHCSQYTDSGVVDGRLRMHDVKTRFFLGCNDCSETIRVVDGDDIGRLISTSAQEVSTAPQPVGEVPMPDTCGELSDRRKIFDEADVRIYGEQCRAAGYAAGVAARLSPEKMRIAAAGWREFDESDGLTGEAAMIDRICSAIDAALRGEVK